MIALYLIGGWYLIGLVSILCAVGINTLFEKQSLPYLFWCSFFGPIVTLIIILEKMGAVDDRF
jgi:hypothetical protein